jgi:hypothetical protein
MSTPNYDNLNRDELLEMLKAILRSIEDLPQPAMLTAPTHYDLYGVVAVIYSILKLDRSE